MHAHDHVGIPTGSRTVVSLLRSHLRAPLRSDPPGPSCERAKSDMDGSQPPAMLTHHDCLRAAVLAAALDGNTLGPKKLAALIRADHPGFRLSRRGSGLTCTQQPPSSRGGGASASPTGRGGVRR
jgi:hypothetical protein